MPRHKSRDRDQILSSTRQRMLAAGAEEISLYGYSQANINHISEAAGFARGTVYNYFSSKALLMSELIDQVAENACEFITAQVLQEHDPRRRLERFYQAGFEFVAQHPAQARLMATTLSGPQAEFKGQMVRANLPLFRLLSQDILEQGIEMHLFHPVDREATVLLLMTLFLGSIAQADQTGKIWLDHRQVAYFASSALLQV
jgi:AcrR family transcriptional regulator